MIPAADLRTENQLRLALAESLPLASDAAGYARAYNLGVVGYARGPRAPEDALCYEPIVARQAGRFELGRLAGDQRGATLAILFGVRDRAGRLADLAAWIFDAPDLRLCRSALPAVGLEHIAEAGAEPLPVHESPLAFLRADRWGLFIHDFARAGEALAGVTLAASNLPAARRLRERLAPSSPRIVVPEAALG